jgi:thymidylate synthase
MGEREAQNQNYLRGDGKSKLIPIFADTIADASYQAIVKCHELGARVETPKHHQDGSLGYDADISIRVENPAKEPSVCFPALCDSALGTMQYLLEVTHGIHNRWKKDAEHPTRWGYTYNERFVGQIPHILQRIKADWDKTLVKEGEGRITGRDYNFGIWRADEDIIPEQEDPPCFQRGQFKFMKNSNGVWVMNYHTDWRSRDLFKAWNENVLAQAELMKLFGAKVSDMLETPIELGAYIDRASSLHLYGFYIDRDNLDKQVETMKSRGTEALSMSLDDFLMSSEGGGTKEQLKRIIAAQSDAESKGYGEQQPVERLMDLGYDLEKFPYPKDWDSWPKEWDAEPDTSKLKH